MATPTSALNFGSGLVCMGVEHTGLGLMPMVSGHFCRSTDSMPSFSSSVLRRLGSLGITLNLLQPPLLPVGELTQLGPEERPMKE